MIPDFDLLTYGGWCNFLREIFWRGAWYGAWAATVGMRWNPNREAGWRLGPFRPARRSR